VEEFEPLWDFIIRAPRQRRYRARDHPQRVWKTPIADRDGRSTMDDRDRQSTRICRA
jgi:hypothetical protein